MYTVTCSQCQEEIDIATEGYLALPLATEQWPAQKKVYLHVGACATAWEAEQRKAAQSPDEADDGPQLRLL